MKNTLRRISGKIVIEEVDSIEQTKGPLVLEIKNSLTQTFIKGELKEFEIEIGLPPIDKIDEIGFYWNLQGKIRYKLIKHFSVEFLKKRAIKKAKNMVVKRTNNKKRMKAEV